MVSVFCETGDVGFPRRSVPSASIFSRLLVLLLLCHLAVPLWAQGERDDSGNLSDGTQSVFGNLVLSPDAPWCLTDAECSFSVVLPGIAPSRVRAENPTATAGARFWAAYKDLAADGKSTSLRFLFSFSQAGSVQLPPLNIVIDGVTYQLPFAPIEVFQDSRTLAPRLVVIFQDVAGQELSAGQGMVPGQELSENHAGFFPATEGQPIFIVLQLQYAAACTALHWELVPDALFQQEENFQEDFNQTAAELSHQLHTIARFRLVPLKTGRLEVPPMEVEVRGYDGNLFRLSTGIQYVLSQKAAAQPAAANPATAALAAAFTLPPVAEEEPELQIDFATAQELAELRRLERANFPWRSFYQQRAKREADLGLEPGERERSWPVVRLLLGMGILLVAVTLAAALKKKLRQSVFAGFCGIVVLAVALVYGNPLFQPSGILASARLSKIPETDAANLFPVAPYRLVGIQKESRGWYYVSAGELEGWIPADMVVRIESP